MKLIKVKLEIQTIYQKLPTMNKNPNRIGSLFTSTEFPYPPTFNISDDFRICKHFQLLLFSFSTFLYVYNFRSDISRFTIFQVKKFLVQNEPNLMLTEYYAQVIFHNFFSFHISRWWQRLEREYFLTLKGILFRKLYTWTLLMKFVEEFKSG